MYKKILVCLDGSNLSEQILPYAMEQAIRFNSKVILFQAFMVPTLITAAEAQSAPPAPVITPEFMREKARKEESGAKSYLERIAKPMRAMGLDVECVTREGEAGDVIIDFAHDESIDLIALATHGHGGLGRVIFGSVADYVLKKSGLPILVIKPQEPEK